MYMHTCTTYDMYDVTKDINSSCAIKGSLEYIHVYTYVHVYRYMYMYTHCNIIPRASYIYLCSILNCFLEVTIFNFLPDGSGCPLPEDDTVVQSCI